MKRLQFRHNNEVFSTRELALQYFSDIVNSTNTASSVFESSLYAEPLVAKYLDEDGNIQVIFAIGVDSGLTPYHIIDSKEMAELIAKNAKNIEEEKLRAIAAEDVLNNNIISETNRAIEAEKALQNNINKEQERVETVENNLQEQIINNIATISIIEPSSANVLEEFVLKNKNGEKLGESIKIYKDSSLVGATIGFKGASTVNKDADGNFILVYSESERDENIKYLYLIYKGENGELKLVGIDFENFLLEAEFGSGLKILEHVVSIKVKDGDKYLNVDADGLYSINIDESIASATTIINEKIDAKIIALSGEVNTFINKVSDNEVKNTELENRVKELENKLTNLEGTIKDIIKSYIVGTEKEIKVFENENKLKIGFDDNAIFGNIPNI